MPTFPVSFPALWPAHVNARKLRSQAISRSPLTFVEQVYDHGGRAWAIDVEMQPMSQADAATFGAFLDSLDGMVGTFNFNLDPWVLGTAPGTKVFRFTQPDFGWSSEMAVRFGFTFTAEEVV